MLGVTETLWPYFDHDRQIARSVVLNGMFFLRSCWSPTFGQSLSPAREKLLEILAILHVLSALFCQRAESSQRRLVRWTFRFTWCGAAVHVLAPFRSRWRLLVAGWRAGPGQFTCRGSRAGKRANRSSSAWASRPAGDVGRVCVWCGGSHIPASNRRKPRA